MTQRESLLIHLLRKMKIQSRLFCIFLFLSLVPVLFIGIFAYHTYTNSINEKVGLAAEQNVALLNQTLATELERYAFYINSLSVLDTVQQILSEPPKENFTLDSGDVRDIRKAVTDTTIQPIYLRNIRIADRNGNVVYDFGYDDVSAEQYREVLRNIDSVSPRDLLADVHTFRAQDNLVLGRKIYRYASAGEHIGYIMVYINEKLLSETIYPGISYGSDSQILLISCEGRVLSSKNHRFLGSSVDEAMFRDLQGAHERGRTSFHTIFNGDEALAAFSYSAPYDCFFVATVPRSYIANETRHITQSLAVVAALLILLCAVAAWIVYRSIMSPIRNIVAHCNVVSDEDVDKAIGDRSPDELGFLARTIDRIIAELKGMALEWQHDQRRKRELELEMLRYQINPHFLFNTLNTLRWVAAMNEVPVLEEGISSLSALLQSTLIRNDELNTIGEEIANLRHYFAIQRIRYADSFAVHYALDEDLLDYRIPRFIAQPIAENAVLHGTDNGSRKINITIHCYKSDDGDVVIAISDDGVGFAVEKVPVDTNVRFSGIGLKNVDERLRLYFGDAYGLQMNSSKHCGTTCTIVVPQSWLRAEGKRDVSCAAGG